MKVGDMNQQELGYFDYLNTKFEITASSTEDLRAIIKQTRTVLQEQEEQTKQEFESKRMYLAEVERIIANIEKGIFRK
jgi:hypothetical protein